mmetsp:Transcript_5672/g.19275  ORF Transcript_5672/g.19275 Transcript_5672/m.19275 type:complete len:353 (+) Transcript_5672:2909-3967(+)
MRIWLPFLMKALPRMGSSAGSISSSTSCSSTGEPNWIAFSISRIMLGCPRLITRRLRSFSMFFTHLFACPCGSTMSGQRRPRVTMTPFSVEKASAGSPWMFQSRTSLGLARKLAKSNTSLAGMLRTLIAGSHVLSTSSSRYSLGKGPAYERKAAATMQSPGTLVISLSKRSMLASQRVRSPARPVTSFSARSSLISSSSLSACRRSLEEVDSSYWSLSACTLARTSARASLALARAACFLASVSCALLSLARFGATSLDTCPYVSIARTHRHSPLAAPDTLPMTSGVKSLLSVYFLIFLRRASTRRSLSNLRSRSMKLVSPSSFLQLSQVGAFLSTVITAPRVSSTSAGGLA